jgi:hypothetical protein
MSFDSFLKTFGKKKKGLNALQIDYKCRKLNIQNFKGVFMRDELKKTASNNECLVLNIDHSNSWHYNSEGKLVNGTHWTCLFIKDKVCYYFDSYGLPPPLEVEKYLHKFNERYYNSFDEIQKGNQVICGHLCIYMLHKLDNGVSFEEILNELFKYNN